MVRDSEDDANVVDVVDVVAYFLDRDRAVGSHADVTPMKLQKLLYLAQANFLAFTGRRLFDENILAYKDGPVVRKVWRQYQGRSTALVHSGVQLPQHGELEPTVEDFLGKVWDRWSSLSAGALRNLTHEQDPWRDHYVLDEKHIRIPDEDMVAYFTTKAPLDERVYPVASVHNKFDVPDSSDEQGAGGMFARPQGGITHLPARPRTKRLPSGTGRRPTGLSSSNARAE